VTTALADNAVASSQPDRGEQVKDALSSFAAALNRGDLRSAVACFTREGCLITPDRTTVHGRGDIAPVLAQMIARRTEIEIDRIVVRRAGDVALASGHLTMRSAGPGGTQFVQACDPTMVIRKVEGSWKLAVVAPWDTH
jgi:uncharacterized protein (TIGR02246 family)